MVTGFLGGPARLRTFSSFHAAMGLVSEDADRSLVLVAPLGAVCDMCTHMCLWERGCCQFWVAHSSGRSRGAKIKTKRNPTWGGKKVGLECVPQFGLQWVCRLCG